MEIDCHIYTQVKFFPLCKWLKRTIKKWTTKAIWGRRLLLLYCSAVMLWERQTQGLIVILCRDWALSRPGWLASLHTWQAERCGVSGGVGVHHKGAGMWLKSQESMRLVYHCNHVPLDCQTKGFRPWSLFTWQRSECASTKRWVFWVSCFCKYNTGA